MVALICYFLKAAEHGFEKPNNNKTQKKGSANYPINNYLSDMEKEASIINLGESPFKLTAKIIELIDNTQGTIFDLELSDIKADICQIQP